MIATPRSIADARACCVAIGKDPDEIVSGFFQGERDTLPRWQRMLGADAGTAAGATELSPRQVALLRSRRPA